MNGGAAVLLPPGNDIIQATEAARWITHHPAIDGCRPVACNYGEKRRGCSSGSPGNLWSLHLHTNSSIPASHKHRGNAESPPALHVHLRSSGDARVVVFVSPHGDSRHLPAGRTAAAHDNALNCLQSDQQMTPRGSSPRRSLRSGSLMPRSRRKHLPNSSIRSPAQTHHLLLGIWVTRAVQMSPDGERHQRKAVSHPPLAPLPPAAEIQ